MSWRTRLILLHRDVGYFCLGLTVVYAVSGVAVNHRHHWDYNFTVEATVERVGTPAELLGLSVSEASKPAELADAKRPELVARLTTVLGRANPPLRVFWRGSDRLSLFFKAGDRDTVDYRPSEGTVEHTAKRDKLFFRDINFLHLNEGHWLWTYIADLYAAFLIFLAVSGAIVVKGRRGLRGRGGILVGLGIALPIVALILMR